MPIRGPGAKPTQSLPTANQAGATDTTQTTGTQETQSTQKTTEVQQNELHKVEDGYDGQNASPSDADSPVNQSMRRAVKKYEDKLDYIFGFSPKAMAEGRMPYRNGDNLTAEQQRAVEKETKRFVKDMPIGAFSPDTVSAIRAFAEEHGVDTTNLEGMSINDLGDVAGDIGENIAKGYVNKLKGGKPGVYYGVLGAGAAAVGALGYTKGSDALRKLGIRPQIKTKLFNDTVTAKIKAAWDPKLENPVLGLYGQRNFNLNNGARVSLGGGVVAASGDKTASGNWEVIGTEVEAQYRSERVNLYARGYFNSSDHNVGTDGKRQPIRLNHHAPETMRSAFDGGTQSHVRLGGSVRGDDWFAAGYYQRNLDTSTWQSGLSAGYKPNDRVEAFATGSYNSQSKSGQVGVGIRVRF
jgi:hypothetical protein